MTGVSHEEVIRAINMKEFQDFEDCLQDRCAGAVNADYIITRITGDYIHSEAPAILPEELLRCL